MTPAIQNALQANPQMAVHRNTNANIAGGSWVWKLTDGSKVVVVTHQDDITPIEQWFSQPHKLQSNMPVVVGNQN